MTWVTLCSRDMGYSFALDDVRARLNKLANSWTAEPPFVQARSPKLRPLIQGEGRRKASGMTRDRGRSHSRRIPLVKQSDQMLMEINFVTAFGGYFESHP